jgi:TonB family protein
MRVVVRPETKRLQRVSSFMLSACVHGSVLAWVALGPLLPKAGPANLYEQEIRPNANRLVWYNLRDRLPDIAPSARASDRRPPRAHTQSPRILVAGAKDTPRASQIIWLPAPSLPTPQIVPSPNVLALTPPSRPVRQFALVEQARPKLLTPALPEAPQFAAAQPKAVLLPPPARPQPRNFTPPSVERIETVQPILPAAPELTVAMASPTAVNALLRVQPARRTFVPPVEARHAPVPQPASLPDAPQVQEKPIPQAPPEPLTAVARAVRPFNAPDMHRGQPARPVDPLAEAPSVSASNHAPEAALAIVSLLPARQAEIPAPKASQEAGFSAGPRPQIEGAASAENHQLVVPGLLAQAGPQDQRPSLLASLEAPTSTRNLLAAARAVRVPASALPMAISGSVRVAAPPGSRLTGRVVYSVAIQMPNVTSYSGSWIIWFAEREPVPGQVPDVHAPLALRKVDPKYVAAAVDEKVEGKVRLAAIIRKDGRVDTVEILQRLDDRLDRSAQEALAQWQFEPAMRDGTPVDVDAVFEIPFHLAPRSPK